MKDPGTPETRARLAAHPIWTLLQRKFILPEHADAAWEIESAFRTLTDPAGWRCMRFDGDGVELRNPSFVAHMGDVRSAQIQDLNRWGAEMARRGLGRSYRAVIDCLTEVWTLREMERMRRWRNGEAKRKIRDGLQIYCEVVGTL